MRMFGLSRLGHALWAVLEVLADLAMLDAGPALGPVQN
ncbi:hypothetical protein A2U01_0107025, partial [Trifolium medium]|nr:hypothetical protein [Trifolium medium]